MAVSLGEDVLTGNPVVLEETHRQSGLYIIGKPGMGKTTLIENLVAQDFESGAGVCVLDPSGDLIQRLVARVPEHRQSEVILLDPMDYESPFGLNPFDCGGSRDPLLVNRVQGQFVDIFRKLWGDEGSLGSSWGPRLEDLLRTVALTFIENPPYTMAEISRLLTDTEFRHSLVANVSNDEVRRFWADFDGLRGQALSQEVGSTMNKVRAFLTQPIVRNIIGQSQNSVPWRKLMDESRIVLVPLRVGLLGPDTVHLIGSLIVLQILNAALSREELRSTASMMPRFNLYADEYRRFATESFATLLEEARKYEVSVTVAHQHRAQLDPRNQKASLMAGSLVIFGVEGSDAEELAKQFDNTPTPTPTPARRPTLRPVEHLVQRGHTDEIVSTIAAGTLASLWERAHLRLEMGVHYQDNYKKGYLDGLQLSQKRGLDYLDEYLRDMMNHKLEPKSRAEAHKVARIAWELQEHWLTAVAGPIETVGFRKYRMEDPPLDFLNLLVDIAMARFQKDWATREVRILELAEGLHKYGARTYYEGSAEEFDTTMWTFMYLGEKLLDDPILVETGQYEMVSHQRPYSDMQNEMMNKLANLGRFRSQVKVLQGDDPLTVEYAQFEIRTPVPASPASELDVAGTLETIRHSNQEHGYLRPRLVVEDEIHWRQSRPAEASYYVKPPERFVPLSNSSNGTIGPPRTSMFCLACGRTLEIDARYCLYCGAATDSSLRRSSSP